jgi:co-chaperonin GroES (HSP10)
VKKGDKVNFPRKSASVIVIDEEDFYFTSEHKIFYYEQREQL